MPAQVHAQPIKMMRTAGAVLFAATSLCVAAIFVLTAHGNYGYGRDVLRLDRTLAWAVVVSLDVLQVVAITGAFILLAAPLRVRVYAWSVFSAANAGSIASNLADADARRLSWQGMLGAALLPVLLSVGVHFAIVAWRWRPTTAVPADTADMAAVAEDAVPDLPPAEVMDIHPGEHDSQPAGRQPASSVASGEVATIPAALRETARRRFAAGETDCAVLAADCGVHRRTVQLWVRDLRPVATNGGQR